MPERELATDADREKLWAELLSFYADNASYGVLSQTAHGLQTAFKAEQAGQTAS
jgi:predicted HD phosphohydrolase